MLESALPALTARVGNGSEELIAPLLKSHTPAQDAAKMAAVAAVKCLGLSHLVPADDPSYGEADWREAVAEAWNGPLVIGHDGVRISLPTETPPPR